MSKPMACMTWCPGSKSSSHFIFPLAILFILMHMHDHLIGRVVNNRSTEMYSLFSSSGT